MRKAICLVLSLTVLWSCEKAFMEKDPADTPLNNFEQMWTTLDRRYSFFTYKNIDWDSVHTAYSGRIYPEMNRYELFEVLSDMLFELRDGHVNLRSEFDVSRNWQWYLDYPENFNYSVVERNYLKNEHMITGPLQHTIIDSVGYIYYESFSSTVSAANIDFVISRFRNLKGIIIDVRNNGGGSTQHIETIVSRFADTKRHVYDHYFKGGPGHDNFYETPVPEYIGPGGPVQFTKKVAVLTNRKCYSATTQFIQAMRVFPHVIIMGDTSGGGGGYPISSELPNGWIYRFSSDMTLGADGLNLEGGIPPDITVSLDPEDEQQGVDSIIERALGELMK